MSITSTDTKHRTEYNLYPDYSAEVQIIESEGITTEILKRIIDRHEGTASYMEELYKRYQVHDGALPIFSRLPRFSKDDDSINNHLNNDYFGEIVDFKTGYFAGKAIVYGYSATKESEEMSGGEEAVERARKLLSDFITRNNMYDIDMETTKTASICGYCGRLFYVDIDGTIRVMMTPPFQTILLYKDKMTEPKYAVRYFCTVDCLDRKILKAEFYNETDIYYYQGNNNSGLELIKSQNHKFEGCPLIGIPNNEELMGDIDG